MGIMEYSKNVMNISENANYSIFTKDTYVRMEINCLSDVGKVLRNIFFLQHHVHTCITSAVKCWSSVRHSLAKLCSVFAGRPE